jgi:nitroreductase
VYEHDNVHGARLIVAIVGKAGLDTGRAAQNMMLVAWNEGIGSCPNGFSDPEASGRRRRLRLVSRRKR